MNFVFEKIDIKYCSLYMKDLILDISVCIWKKIDIEYWSLYLKDLILNIEVCNWTNLYWILKFVFEKIDINPLWT